MNLNLCGYALIALLLFICLKIYQESDMFHLKYIISDADGKKYVINANSKESAVYVFCYGELIHLKTVKEVTQPKKSCPVTINGLKRSLNVMGKNHLVFGINDDKSEWCNGILIKVSPTELTRLQKREKLYTLKTLDKKRVEFPYKKKLQFNPDDVIVSFYPQAKYVLTKTELMTKQQFQSQLLRMQDYVHTCQMGAADVSREFYKDFTETTTTPV